MTTQELVDAVILKATGKKTALSPGDTRYEEIVAIANTQVDTWQNEPGVEWNSLYDRGVSLGSVTATDTFPLDSSIRKISDRKGDHIRIEHSGSDAYSDYATVPHDRLKDYTGEKVCAQIGSDLVFSEAFTSDDPEYNGTLKVPAYTYASKLSAADDEVPVDIPNWLVFMTAAEYVRNDVVRQNQYPNLISEANEMMQAMISDNEAQIQQVTAPWSPLGRTW